MSMLFPYSATINAEVMHLLKGPFLYTFTEKKKNLHPFF
uniref:Uncharacterized protein n=1 Tax=Arundo donax TaxID=35708 RepID=A0A0A9HP05_ARUDO